MRHAPRANSYRTGRCSRVAAVALVVLAAACREGEAHPAADAAMQPRTDASQPRGTPGVDAALDADAAMQPRTDASQPITDSAIDAASASECRDALPLRCGDRLTQSTITDGQPDLWSTYPRTARLESGRETVYAFRSDASCQVSVRLSDLDKDIDLFVLDACDPLACIEHASTPLDLQTHESVAFHAEGQRDYLVAVDGYAGASGSYSLAVSCLCGASAEFADGAWTFHVDRRWNGDPSSVKQPSTPRAEADYESVADGPSYAAQVSDAWHSVSIGSMPWLGELTASPSGTLSYDLTSGTFAGARFIVWASASGLQAELTMYGSGVPIASSERGALIQKP
jgi:hypothetical protein